MPKFSFLAKSQLFHLTDLNLWSCWTRQEDDGAGRVRGKSPRPRFWQGWARAGQQKTPLLMPKIEGPPNATSYTVFWQQKQLTLADGRVAHSCACSQWADGRQRTSWFCEAASMWDKSPFQLFYAATESQGKAASGKKHLEITGIYYERETLSDCPKGVSFCMTHAVLTSCSLGAKRSWIIPGLSAQCWM